jgi:hypothetical protein
MGLAQAGGSHGYFDGFAQNVEQYHDGVLAIFHLVDGFQTGEWPVGLSGGLPYSFEEALKA